MLQTLRGEVAEIVHNLSVVLLAIAAIDVGRKILYIYIIMGYVGDDLLQAGKGDVERGLDVDVPLRRTPPAELGNGLAAQQGLAAAEADAAARGLEVEVVEHHLLQQLTNLQLPPHAFRAQALAVQTVATAQRTAVEGHQRGDARAVGGQAVAADAYEW